MPVSNYLFSEFNEDELALILAIHNNFSDNTYMDLNMLACMKFQFFVEKIKAARSRSTEEGIKKINQILSKIDEYIKG